MPGADLVTPTRYRRTSILITPWSVESIGVELASMTVPAPASAVPLTANKAIYVPFQIAEPVTVVKLFWANGATAGTDNIDTGIYDNAGTRLTSSGAVLSAGASILQESNITDITLPGPAKYYMAFVTNGTTATQFRSTPAAGLLEAMGVYVQTSAYLLPSSATFAKNDAATIPLFGLALRTLVA